MNKWLEILFGLILVIGAVYIGITNWYGFGTAGLIVLKGGIGWGVLGLGLLFLLLGISDLRG